MNKFQFDLKKAFFQRRVGISEHRQFQIMEIALGLIEKHGFEQLTFGELAKKCRVSRALVHHYFHDKFALANQLLELSTLHLQNYVQTAVAQEKDPTTHFEAYCRATLDWPTQHQSIANGLLLFLHLSSSNLEMRKRNDELSAAGRQRIKLFLAEMGCNPSRLDEHAHTIQTLLTGAYLVLLSENHSPSENLKLRQACLKTCMLIARS